MTLMSTPNKENKNLFKKLQQSKERLKNKYFFQNIFPLLSVYLLDSGSNDGCDVHRIKQVVTLNPFLNITLLFHLFLVKEMQSILLRHLDVAHCDDYVTVIGSDVELHSCVSMPPGTLHNNQLFYNR